MARLLRKPVRSESLVEKVVERLEMAIMTGELQGGSRLSEQGLATSLGVSRGPLREALRRLEGRRLIERIPNIGARVATMSQRDLQEVLVIREALEGVACRLAAINMTDKNLAELESILDRHQQHVEKLEGAAYYQSPDYDFHTRIIELSGNQKLREMLCGDLYYLMRVHRYRSSAVPGRAKRALTEHRLIVAALAARDPEGAEAAMRRHLGNAHANLSSNVPPAPIAEPDAVAADLPLG